MHLNIKYTRIKEFSLILYLISFLFPFIHPSSYVLFVKMQFSILMPIVLYFYFNKGVLNGALILLLAYTLVLTFFGLPASVFGYVSSAMLGLFMAKILMRGRGDAQGSVFKVSAFIYILLSGWILYSADDPLLYGDYFGIASINYAGLTVASFCIMYITYFIHYKFCFDCENLVLIRSSNLISILLLCILVLMLAQFGTRTIITAAATILIFLLSRMKIKFVIVGVFCFAILAINHIQYLYEIILEAIVPGRSALLDIYTTELAGDQERVLAIAHVFESVVTSFGFCFGCSDKFSYSGLSNLLAYSFPFSLLFLYLILKYCLASALSLLAHRGKMFLLNIMLWTCFISSFIQTLLQPDFLSITALFYVVGVGLEIYKHCMRRLCGVTEISL